MSFRWTYYSLHGGRLFDDSGKAAFPSAPKFNSAEEANWWLVDQNETGSVRDVRAEREAA